MTKIDQFESVFRSAAKTPYVYDAVSVQKIALVSDLVADDAETFANRVRRFLRVLADHEPEYVSLAGDDFYGVGDLLQQLQGLQPDLIVTYRNLRMPAHEHPYSLGTHVDVLTQVMSYPVLLMPHPFSGEIEPQTWDGTMHVIAITDHLAGDDRLVNVAVAMTLENGKLTLTLVEDQQTFERYMKVIEKLPSIDSQEARTAIHQQLLKEPHDYITSCRQALQERQFPVAVDEVIVVGHHLSEYKRLVAEHDVHLLVMNTKDEDQLAMHGLAYPLAVELRHIPLLLI